MKKFLTISVILFMSISIFAQNVELSNKLIEQYKAGQLKASQKSANIHDYLWLTPILTEAVINWDVLTDDAKNLFKDYRNRPTFTGTEETATMSNFLFHYTTDGPVGESVDPTDVNPSNGTPDYVDNMMSKFSDMYVLYHTTTGLTVPPSDGTNGGSGLYDIYISGDAAGDGVYGWVMAEDEIGDNPNSTTLTEVDAYSSFMVMRNNYEGFGDENVAMSVTSAHEYMHATQNGYAVSMDSWFKEIGATWGEEFAYPGYDDNFQYLMGIFGKPDVALNLEDGEAPEHDGHWYSSFLFAQYMTEQTDNSIMKSIYERCIIQYAVDAIDTELSENWESSLNEMFLQFAIANVLLTDDNNFAPFTYNRATDYETYVNNNGGFAFENLNTPFNYTGTDITWNSQTDGNDRLMRLSADYFILVADENFKITFSPTDATDETGLILIKATATSIQIVVMDDNGSINVTDQANWDLFVSIVIRADKGIDNVDPYDYNLTITAASPASIGNISESNINIFPNPANEFISINSTTELQSFEIVDLTGKVVFSDYLTNSQINVNNIENGVYFIKLYDNKGVAKTEKLIIAN